MESFEQKKDEWRDAILKERENKSIDPFLKEILLSYKGERKNALLLGDASLVQSNWFLNDQGFEHVVDVDSSPSLLDDEIVPLSDTRLERVMTTFDLYDSKGQEFDCIYGKSIAFNPKELTPNLLKDLSRTLTNDGVFYAVWAGAGDSYRQGISYTEEEIESLYKDAGFEILKKEEIEEQVKGLMGREGRAHYYKIFARHKGE